MINILLSQLHENGYRYNCSYLHITWLEVQTLIKEEKQTLYTKTTYKLCTIHTLPIVRDKETINENYRCSTYYRKTGKQMQKLNIWQQFLVILGSENACMKMII